MNSDSNNAHCQGITKLSHVNLPLPLDNGRIFLYLCIKNKKQSPS